MNKAPVMWNVKIWSQLVKERVRLYVPVLLHMSRYTAFSLVYFSFHELNNPNISYERQVREQEHIFLFGGATAAAWQIQALKREIYLHQQGWGVTSPYGQV